MSEKITKNTLQVLSKLGRATFDGLENMLTGLGVAGRDKRLGAKYKFKHRSQTELESFYDSSDIAKVAVNKIPSMGTKKWITHKVDRDEGGVELANKFVDEDNRLKAKKKFQKAWEWARLYGGSVIYMSVLDGLDPVEPLNVNRIRMVRSLTVLHRFEVHPNRIDWNIDSPNFGRPETYTISTTGQGEIQEIHHTRLLRFDGESLSQNGFQQNSYWDDSILNVIHDVARDYDSAYNSILHALQDFDVDILKMNDLAEICAGEDDSILISRLKLMSLSKSIMGSIALDAENESLEKLQRQFQNVDKMLDKADKRLQLATGLPHTVLFGEGSTGGLNAKGESERDTLNDLVSGEQDKVLTDNIDRYGIIIQAAKQGPTNGKIIKSWSYSYNPFNEPTDKQTAEVRKLVAETDKIYYEIQAISSD